MIMDTDRMTVKIDSRILATIKEGISDLGEIARLADERGLLRSRWLS